ncbi:MAG: DM13 domain-containing protein [Chitinophagaceae bacterium]|nr:DM13 domain-containing protein [Chitinophagaceae bacterium]
MKNTLIILFAGACLFFNSCTKKTSTAMVNEMVDTTTAVLKYQGNFQKGPYGTVSGSVMIYQTNGKWQLKLTNFSTTNGPDLKVYLSKEVQPLSFIKLGDLKSTTGNQVYDINGSPDFMQYKYALIHCEQYNHLFGSAELMMP